MNLTTDPWIPVTDAHGMARLVNLRHVFAEGGTLQDLAVRPHERVALMRLLICIAQAALKGPADSDALESCGQELPAAAERYFDEWKESFDLFHREKPFLQFPGLMKPPKEDAEEAKPNGVTKLDFCLATGNNSTLFDHGAAIHERREMNDARIALSLITFQCFAPSEIVGAAKWKTVDVPKVTAPTAPCTPKAMIHAFVRRDNLIETITANLLTSTGVAKNYKRPWGKPVWEIMPKRLTIGESPDLVTQSYLGRLVPLSRAILLNSDRKTMILANGLRYLTFPDFPAEPSASVIEGKKDPLVLVSAGQRHIWRQLPALVIKRLADGPGGPLTLSELSLEHDFDFWVGALLASKDEGIVDTVEGIYPVPARMLNDTGRLAYEGEVKESERVAWKLGDACKTYRQHLELKPQGYPEQSVALRRFWTSIEQHLSLLHGYLNAPDGTDAAKSALAQWRSALWNAAHDAFNSACGNDNSRQLRAHALALRSLQRSQRLPAENSPSKTVTT